MGRKGAIGVGWIELQRRRVEGGIVGQQKLGRRIRCRLRGKRNTFYSEDEVVRWMRVHNIGGKRLIMIEWTNEIR